MPNLSLLINKLRFPIYLNTIILNYIGKKFHLNNNTVDNKSQFQNYNLEVKKSSLF